MFNEPTEREVNLLPLVVHAVEKGEERKKMIRSTGFGIYGQITMCLSGEGIFTDAFKHTHKISPGDIFFVKPETAHIYEPSVQPWRVKYILFSGCEIKDIFESLNLPASGVVTADTDGMNEAAELVSAIHASYESNTVSRHIIASADLYRLLTVLARCSAGAAESVEAAVNKLTPAVHYIKNHFNDVTLTTELIAEHAGFSHSHMCRLFTEAYNLTPHDFLIAVRLGHAKGLLSEQKNLTVRQIAAATGFNSASYFTKVFKANTGLTPVQFRSRTTYSFLREE